MKTAGSGDAQVIVSSTAGINCTAAATRPGCDAAGLSFDNTGTLTCVVDLSGLDPDYIAEIPLDPLEGESTAACVTGSGCVQEGDLVIGATNTGYYLERGNGNRIEIGACHPDQSETIKVKR